MHWRINTKISFQNLVNKVVTTKNLPIMCSRLMFKLVMHHTVHYVDIFPWMDGWQRTTGFVYVLLIIFFSVVYMYGTCAGKYVDCTRCLACDSQHSSSSSNEDVIVCTLYSFTECFSEYVVHEFPSSKNKSDKCKKLDFHDGTFFTLPRTHHSVIALNTPLSCSQWSYKLKNNNSKHVSIQRQSLSGVYLIYNFLQVEGTTKHLERIT